MVKHVTHKGGDFGGLLSTGFTNVYRINHDLKRELNDEMEYEDMSW